MPGMPTFTGGGALTPTVNPTAMNLVQQSMSGGLPLPGGGANTSSGGLSGLLGLGQDEDLKKQFMKMLLGGGGPLFSMQMGNKGIKVGGGGGAGVSAGGTAGNMDLMTLLSLMNNTKGGPAGGSDPRRIR